MSKRKWRILYSAVVGLCVCISVLMIGVFAASQQSAGIGSNIKFRATSISATVDVGVYDNSGDNPNFEILKNAVVGSDKNCCKKSQQIADINIGSTASIPNSSLNVTIDDIDHDLFILKNSSFVVNFTITPKTGDDKGGNIYYCIKFVPPSAPDPTIFNAMKYKIIGDTGFSNYTNAGVTNSDPLTTSPVTISFLYQIDKDYCQEFKNVAVGSYTIYMANSVQHLNELLAA